MNNKKKIILGTITATATVLMLLLFGMHMQNGTPPQPLEIIIPDGAQEYILSEGWNLISLADNATKDEIIIMYNNSPYLWGVAVMEQIIINFIYRYEGGGYLFADKFIVGKGYWMYSYHDNVTLIDGNIIYCGKINLDINSTHIIRGKKLVVSPTQFDNEITCCGIEVDEVIFKTLNVEEIL